MPRHCNRCNVYDETGSLSDCPVCGSKMGVTLMGPRGSEPERLDLPPPPPPVVDPEPPVSPVYRAYDWLRNNPGLMFVFWFVGLLFMLFVAPIWRAKREYRAVLVGMPRAEVARLTGLDCGGVSTSMSLMSGQSYTIHFGADGRVTGKSQSGLE